MPKGLMKSVKDGDEDALAQIIKEHYVMIYRYCYWKTQNSDIAQDITQDTFLKFVSHINTYSNYGKLQAYLYTIARNLCNDWYRKKKPISLDTQNEIIDFSALDTINRIVDNVTLKQLIDKLPSAQQEVIILRYGQDLKLRDIATITGTTIFAVQYRLKTALLKLRKKLD